MRMNYRNLGLVLTLFLGGALVAQAQDQMKDTEYKTIGQALGTGAGTTEVSTSLQQWFNRITIGGDLNVGFVKTGAGGGQPNGLFYAGGNIYGANLFIDAELGDGFWAHSTLSVSSAGLGVEELYVESKDFLHTDGLVSAKAGRMDIPFVEEYLWQFPFENPMVLRTTAWPWDEDEGVEAFGKAGQLSYVAAVMSGSSGTYAGADDSPYLSLVGRVGFDPTDWLHLGASAMENGNHASSAEAFNFVHITPVAGSPSKTVDFQAYETDATVKIAHLIKLSGDGGLVSIDDVNPYSRTLYYYYGQAQVNLTDEFYVCGRYSAIGTFDSTEGYKFGGDYDGAFGLAPTPGGIANFDTDSLSRVGVALGYKLNDSTILKVEVDDDTLQMISSTPAFEAAAAGGNRYTYAGEVDVKF
jgi:hypothetical protein